MIMPSTDRSFDAASSTMVGLCSMKRNRTPGARSAASRDTTLPTVTKP
jgi:hypothetical protein